MLSGGEAGLSLLLSERTETGERVKRRLVFERELVPQIVPCKNFPHDSGLPDLTYTHDTSVFPTFLLEIIQSLLPTALSVRKDMSSGDAQRYASSASALRAAFERFRRDEAFDGDHVFPSSSSILEAVFFPDVSKLGAPPPSAPTPGGAPPGETRRNEETGAGSPPRDPRQRPGGSPSSPPGNSRQRPGSPSSPPRDPQELRLSRDSQDATSPATPALLLVPRLPSGIARAEKLLIKSVAKTSNVFTARAPPQCAGMLVFRDLNTAKIFQAKTREESGGSRAGQEGKNKPIKKSSVSALKIVGLVEMEEGRGVFLNVEEFVVEISFEGSSR